MLARDASRDDPVPDVAALVSLVDAFSAETGKELSLSEPPTHHPRGGYRLAVLLQAGDEEPWVRFLHQQGWSAVH